MSSSVDAGARLAAGGRYDGLFYRPTVLADVPTQSPAFREEIFGPVAPVVTFDTIDQAVALARDTEYGLSLGIGLSIVAGHVFRIGHLGDLNELMVLSALSGVELTLRDQGVPFTSGSGVAAAIEHFHRTRPAQLAQAA